MPSFSGADNFYTDYGLLTPGFPIANSIVVSQPDSGTNRRREDQFINLGLSMARQMSRPEHHLSAISWRRLHLARAKLKASSRTSALLSGFAMVAMVEMQINNNSDGNNRVPVSLLVTFTVCTTLLVSVHMLALMISTCILPHVEAVASGIHGLASVNESPHEKMHLYIEIAWTFSTVFGIFLFLIELAILCWVKFWDAGESGKMASLAASITLIPIGIVFVGFAIHFYRTLVSHQFERSERGLQELESMISNLHNDGQQQQQQPFSAQPSQQPLLLNDTNPRFGTVLNI